MPWIIGGAVIGGAYLGSRGAERAAEISGQSADYAADLAYQQYLQTRADLQPYRDVAVGRALYDRAFDPASFDLTTKEGLARQTLFNVERELGTVDAQGYRLDPNTGERTVSGYEGGALQTLSEYGPSRVVEGEYIPASQIPEYQARTPGYETAIAGDVPQYTGEVDVYSDPGYQFRLGEMNRQLRREMAGMGKLTSGNRLEEIMKRSGEMASQEYGAAYQRQLQDYGVQRQVEGIEYARRVGDFDRARQLEQELQSRSMTQYQMDVARENMLYGRGVDAYGRAIGREQDYLNRQAALSGIGQTATAQTAGAGQDYARTAGGLITSAGQTAAAAELGRTQAVTGAIGDLTSLYAMNQMRQQPQYVTDYSIPMTSYSY